MRDIKGKTAIVTGGVQGLGKSIVKALLSEEADIIIFDKNTKGLETLKQEFPHIDCIACELTDIASIENAVSVSLQKHKTIDILVNNAGILYSEPLIKFSMDGVEKHSIQAWDKIITTDLSAVFYLTSIVVEKMVKTRTKGIVINISSVSATGNAGQSAYSAAKAGINALTVTWAKELGAWGIRVAGIAPGYTETPSTSAAMNHAVLKEIVAKTPIRRLGKPEEIAQAVLFAIQNDFINGKILEVDGGLIL